MIAPLVGEGAMLTKPPLLARALNGFPLLRGIPARLVGLGFRPEHIHSLEA